MRRHRIVQTISKLPFEDCLGEVRRLDGLEKVRDSKNNVASTTLEDMMRVIRCKREESEVICESQKESADLIKKYGFDEMLSIKDEEALERTREGKEEEPPQSSDDQRHPAFPKTHLSVPATLDTAPGRRAESLLAKSSDPSARRGGSPSRSSFSRDHNFKTSHQRQYAAELEDNVELDSKNRFFGYLFKLDMPSPPEEQQTIRDVAGILQRGIRDSKQRKVKRGGLINVGEREGAGGGSAVNKPNISGTANELAGAARHLGLVCDQKKPEKEVERAFAGLLNGVLAHINNVSSADIFCGETGKGEALFLCVGHKALKRGQPSTGPGHGGSDKPDMVCLDEPVEYDPKHVLDYQGLRSWGEIKRYAWQDLSRPTIRQHMRYAFRIVTENPMCGRQVGFTLCGPILRIFFFDANGYSCTRAIDVTDDSDANMLDLAQVLLLLTGPCELLQQRLTPDADQTFYVRSPTSAGPHHEAKRMTLLGKPRFLSKSRAAGLFGRRTCVFGGVRAKVTVGHLVGGEWRPSETDSTEREIDVVLKLTWLPEDVLHHEDCVLVHLQQHHVENVPRSHGCIHLQGDWNTMLNEQVVETNAKYGVEAQAPQLYLLAMVLESPTGIEIDYETLPLDVHVRLFRHLVAKLFELAEKDVHYRDLNLGNFLLHPDWERMLKDDPYDSRILLLIDFGNARIANQARAASKRDSANSVYLGLEDALSVNGTFMPCKAIERLELETLLQNALTVPVTDELEVQERDEEINSIIRDISKLDHRFPDDIESAAYCFLVQILFHCRARAEFSNDVTRAFQDEVVYPILDNKLRYWRKANDFRRRLKLISNTVPGMNALIRRGLITALTSIRDHVTAAQEHQRPEDGLPAEIQAHESAAFDKSLEALDTLVASLPLSSQSVPSQTLGKRPDDEGASSAAKREKILAVTGPELSNRIKIPATYAFSSPRRGPVATNMQPKKPPHSQDSKQESTP